MSNPHPYCVIYEDNREHLKTLIRWLWDEAQSAGGDGDAMWFSNHFRVEDLLPLVQEVNSESKRPWMVNLNGKTISWWHDQEWVTITNDEEMFRTSSDWIQAKIRY